MEKNYDNLYVDSEQFHQTHLHRLSVRDAAVNRYLRHCLSSCRRTGSAACVTTTPTTAAATTITGSSSGSSSSSSSAGGTTAARRRGSARGGGGGGGSPGAVGYGDRGPWLTLHGALGSSHL